MIRTLYDVIFIFFTYSFLGWVLETVFATIKQRHLANRGLINGPFCVLYGVVGVIVSVGLGELSGVWLFAGSMICATVFEWIAGNILEKTTHERWWDYSGVKWNLDGYICLYASILWGALGYVGKTWGNIVFLDIFHLLPDMLCDVLIWALCILCMVDAVASYMILKGRGKHIDKWEAANSNFIRISAKIGRFIENKLENRIHKAYKTKDAQRAEEKSTVFACGCSFYKIALLFFIGAFLGDIVETIFCRFTMGRWMSRSSVVWGDFSIVWGFALAAVTLILYRYRNKSEGFLFWIGTFLGGTYEYLCSVFTEKAFGTVFWDYSGMPFNLGGRINLLYCFFWGIAAVVWFKKCYPVISSMIEKIPMIVGRIATWLLVVFMCCNIIVSCMALIRYDQRCQGIEADSSWQSTMDEKYGDSIIKRVYPNAIRN